MFVRIKRKMAIAAIVVGVGAVSTFGQIVGGHVEMSNFGGIHYIVAQVVGPTGRPVINVIRLRLASMYGGDVITTTDPQGKVTFSKIANGSYTLTVDEDEDHGAGSASVEVDVSADESMNGRIGKTFMVTVRLAEKREKAQPNKPAVISSDTTAVPKTALTLYSSALELSKTGDHLGAIEQLQKAVVEYPQFLQALTEIGVQYMILNDLAKADAALLAALKVKPEAYEAQMNRGIVMVRLKRFEDAVTVLQGAIKANGSAALAYYYLGRAQMGLQQYDNAEASFLTSIKSGGDQMREAHRMLAGVYIEKKEDQKAADELDTYLRIFPQATDAGQLRNLVSQLRNGPLPTATPKPL